MTIQLPYIDRFRDRHGKWRYYYRPPGGKRAPLPLPEDPDFCRAYEAAVASAPAPVEPKTKGAPGTFDRLLTDYFASPDFLKTKPSSQRVTRGILEAMAENYGDKRVAKMPREFVSKLIGSRAETPAAANNLLKKLRALMTFAIRNGWRSDDPTLKIPRFKENEHHTWTEAEIEQFEARWPLGSRERTAFAMALYTGQRRGDIVTSTWAAYDAAAGLIEVVQEKTGEALTIPAHSELRQALMAWPATHVVIFATAYGRPFSVAGFGNWFSETIEKTGLPERCVLHGLRKAAARRLAEVGCSSKQIASITGHRSLKEIERYTRAASQKTLAASAMTMLEEHGMHKRIPNPFPKPKC